MSTCRVCSQPVVWSEVLATPQGAAVARLADEHGPAALTEYKQLIWLGLLCAECVTAQRSPEDA